MRCGAATVSIWWPGSAAADCTVWLQGGYIDPHRSGLAIEPLDMRAGTDTALARVVKVFGSVRPHHAYLFASKRAPRIKALFHDCVGIWLVAALSSTATFIWSG